jgi:hypothetical protein
MSNVSIVNPFATRFVRPGALDFQWAEGESVERLVGRLTSLQGMAQIVGPHGSGKSTLLHTLAPHLQAAGWATRWYMLNGQTHRLPTVTFRLAAGPAARLLVIVDGFEQLRWWRRRRLIGRCRYHGAGLLVTTHRDLGLPTLVHLRPTLDMVQRVVRRLLEGDLPKGLILPTDVQDAFGVTGGNVRETLFRLYDVYERRRGALTGVIPDKPVVGTGNFEAKKNVKTGHLC